MPKTEPFDEHYEQYEDWFLKNRYAYESEVRAVERLLPREGRGVEIGIGTGKFALPLGIKTGVEPSVAMRRLATARGLQVHDAVAEDLPFDDEQFDYALMVTTICFVDDVYASLREVFRVVKRQGCIVVGFVDKESPLGRVYEKHKESNVFYRDAVFYSTDEVVRSLSDCGFHRPEIVQTIFGQLGDVDEVQEPREGYGEGGFVVVRATKDESG